MERVSRCATCAHLAIFEDHAGEVAKVTAFCRITNDKVLTDSPCPQWAKGNPWREARCDYGD